MTYSMLHNVWPGILVLFVGPWSDKFGRRPVLLVSFTGMWYIWLKFMPNCSTFFTFPSIAYFIGHILTAMLVSFSKELALNPWFYLLGGLPATIVGGGCAMTTVVFCYISDVSDVDSKPKR